MEKVDFNEYAKDYKQILDSDLEFFGEESGYFAEYKVKIIKESLTTQPDNILEYGCGIGINLDYLKKYFPNSGLTGCDISEKSIEIASKKKDINFFLITDKSLLNKSEKFDLIFVSCVFHHIEPKLREDSIHKIYKLLKPGGIVYIFEHNPNNPITRKIVRDCIWDKDAILLNIKETVNLLSEAGFQVTEKKYTVFFPSQLKFLRPVEKILAKIPLGGQYYVKGVKN